MNQQRLRRVKHIVAFALLIISVVLLIINRGFWYTSYTPSFVAELSGASAAASINAFSGKAGIARIDRDNSRVYFQGIDSSQFNRIVTEVKEQLGVTANSDNANLNIATYAEQPAPVFAVGSNQLTLLMAIIAIAYVLNRLVYRRLDRADRLPLVLVLVMAMIASVISGLGLVSLISRLTMVSELSVVAVIISNILLATTLIWAVDQYVSGSQQQRIDSALNHIGQIFYPAARRLGLLLAGSAVLLAIGLGYRLVLDLLILVASFTIGYYVIHYSSRWWLRLLFLDFRIVGREQLQVAESQQLPAVAKHPSKKRVNRRHR